MTKIFLKRCPGYHSPKVTETVAGLLDQLSLDRPLASKGQTVLVKPNMLSCKTPDHAATTHPAVVEAVAAYFVKTGARVLIGDSPPAVFGRAEEYWSRTGFAEAAKNSGAELVCFETIAKQTIEISTNRQKHQAHVVKLAFDADLIVNLPKLKTHNLTRITGAVKNLFGLVPGLQKAVWHKVFPKSLEFSNFIVDFARQMPAGITLLDAIEGMEGQGPAGGKRIFPGFLMASTCPVAIDRAICRIGGIDENTVSMLNRARELSWGPTNVDQLEFRGDSPNDVKISNFQVPGRPVQDYLPDLLLNSLKKLVWAGPALKAATCIGCGRCKEICPVNAIDIVDKTAQFDRRTCISCFCCMEVCPVDAIEAQKSPLLNLAFKLRNLKKAFKRNK
ncbi:MAG: DUF362 domain-containing protein [Candidatus Rifleibacteriota bacterium]